MDSLSATTVFCIASCAVLWGATDSLMKHCSPAQSSSSGLLASLASLLTSPAYLACLLANQAGSLLYYSLLSAAPLSLASPAVNTGKLLVTILTGRALGEPTLTSRKSLGLLLLLLGILLQLSA